MKTEAVAKIAVKGILAPVFAMMLLAGSAVAEEQADDLLLAEGSEGDLAALDSDALADASGGFAVQIANSEQDTNFTDNPINVDNGAQINTGSIMGLSGNSGGISSMMLNSGNNVSFQNSTTLNVYLDAAQ